VYNAVKAANQPKSSSDADQRNDSRQGAAITGTNITSNDPHSMASGSSQPVCSILMNVSKTKLLSKHVPQHDQWDSCIGYVMKLAIIYRMFLEMMKIEDDDPLHCCSGKEDCLVWKKRLPSTL